MEYDKYVHNYFRFQVTLSDIKNGKSEVGAITLARIATVLNKTPSSYPIITFRELSVEKLRPVEEEFLFHFYGLACYNLSFFSTFVQES